MNLTTKTVYEPCMTSEQTHYCYKNIYDDVFRVAKRENVYVLTPDELKELLRQEFKRGCDSFSEVFNTI